MDRVPDTPSDASPDTATYAEETSVGLPPSRCRIEYRVAAGNAFGADVADDICTSWVQLHRAAASYQQRLRALLHEAFSNALLHGCLEISGFNRSSPQDLLRQEREMSDRLAQKFYASRVITIELAAADTTTVLMVEDEGPGYAFLEDAEPSSTELCIRGMQLIHKLSNSVAVENEGRRIVITVSARP